MLSLISLASLVTLISTAFLPISSPNSPGANNELFQDLNDTSLASLPVIPPNVSSRLNETSISNLTSTASSTNLGIIYAQTHEHPYSHTYTEKIPLQIPSRLSRPSIRLPCPLLPDNTPLPKIRPQPATESRGSR